MNWWRCLRVVLDEVWESADAAPEPVEAVVTPALTRPDPRAAAHVSAAREALYHGTSDDAATDARAALDRSPADLAAAFYLGQAYLRQNRYEEARAAFELARGNDPFGLVAGWIEKAERLLADEPGARATRDAVAAVELERAARAALRTESYAEARDLAAEAIRLAPHNLMAHHYLGQALLALGRREAALAAFEAARPFDLSIGLVDTWIAAALADETPER